MLIPDLTTRDGVRVQMRLSRTEKEWKVNCDAVKAANSGDYPEFWFEEIIFSGLCDEVAFHWGGADQIHIVPVR